MFYSLGNNFLSLVMEPIDEKNKIFNCCCDILNNQKGRATHCVTKNRIYKRATSKSCNKLWRSPSIALTSLYYRREARRFQSSRGLSFSYQSNSRFQLNRKRNVFFSSVTCGTFCKFRSRSIVINRFARKSSRLTNKLYRKEAFCITNEHEPAFSFDWE